MRFIVNLGVQKETLVMSAICQYHAVKVIQWKNKRPECEMAWKVVEGEKYENFIAECQHRLFIVVVGGGVVIFVVRI